MPQECAWWRVAKPQGTRSRPPARGSSFAVPAMNHRMRIACDRYHKQQNAEIQEVMRNNMWCAEKACTQSTEPQCPVNDCHCRTDTSEVVRPLCNFRLKHRSLLKEPPWGQDWPSSSPQHRKRTPAYGKVQETVEQIRIHKIVVSEVLSSVMRLWLQLATPAAGGERQTASAARKAATWDACSSTS